MMVKNKKTLTHSDIQRVTGYTRAQRRYWPTVLPSLRGKEGKRPSFTAAEALALRILVQIVGVIHCDLKMLKAPAESLFAEVSKDDWQRFEHKRLVVYLNTGEIEFISRTIAIDAKESAMILAVDMINHVSAIRCYLLGIPSDQYEQNTSLRIDGKHRSAEGNKAASRTNANKD